MTPYNIYHWARGFRRKRMEIFKRNFILKPETTILDVGGFSGFWRESKIEAQITILRLDEPEALGPDCPPNISSVRGDGCDLSQYGKDSFDIVFSNSVIEHVGSRKRQTEFASESLRVGRNVWMQTPAMEFPIEPHLLMPFYHWLPWSVQEKCFRLTPWALMWKGTPRKEDYEELTKAFLLTRSALRKMYPHAEIITEKFCGLPKSYLVISRENPEHK